MLAIVTQSPQKNATSILNNAIKAPDEIRGFQINEAITSFTQSISSKSNSAFLDSPGVGEIRFAEKHCIPQRTRLRICCCGY